VKPKIFSILFAAVVAVGFSLVLALPVAASGTTYYVATTGSNTNDGLSWETAWRDIQHAIDQADAGDTINVAAGTHNENITLKDGVEVLGAGADVTTIDGGGSGIVVTANNVGSSTKLDGFTITHGSAPSGGGMYNDNSSLTVTGCTFYGNSAAYGGGMYNKRSSPTVTGCTFYDNSAAYGGGMYNKGSSPTVTGCTFHENSASNRGGGMYNYCSSPTLTNCTFYENSASNRGGGMYNYCSSPTLTNCTFYENSASEGGGGMCSYNSSPMVTNCILWDSGQEIYNISSTPVVTYCDIRWGYSGEGNIDTDPLFVNPAGGDYHLQPGSPCIDAGNNAAVPAWLTTDFEGDPRIVDGDGNTIVVVDIGADEYYVLLPNNPPNPPTSPLCEGVTSPSGVTDPTPEFSWIFSDPDGGDTQRAYHILVASTPGNLALNNGDMWDSGKVDSSASQVSYAGTTLAINQTYYWKVQTWDNSEAEGPYCSQQQFTTVGGAPAEFQPPTPQGVSPEAKPRVSWPLVGGIIAAVVIIGLLIFFVVRRRAAHDLESAGFKKLFCRQCIEYQDCSKDDKKILACKAFVSSGLWNKLYKK